MLVGGEYADHEFTLVVPKWLEEQSIPQFQRISVRRGGRHSGHVWEQFDLPRLVRGGELLSLGNTMPLSHLIVRPERSHVMIHDLSYLYFPKSYSWAFRALYSFLIPKILKRAENVFTVSNSEKRAIEAAYPRLARKNAIVAVQNGVTVFPYSEPATAISKGGKYCLYVGSLTKRKNAIGLINAAIELSSKHGVGFHFVGSTSASFESVEVAIPEKCREDLRFLGQINDIRELKKQYEGADVFVFPSFYEASPLPPVEAMSLGVPVVSSNIPSLQERLGTAALYCDPDDVNSIVENVLTLIGDDELRKQMVMSGKTQASLFSWKRQVQEVLEPILRSAN